MLSPCCRLSSLASTVAHLVEAIVKASEAETAESAKLLQHILAAAADEKGEWHWPLPDAQAAAFEQVWSWQMWLQPVFRVTKVDAADSMAPLACRQSVTTLRRWTRRCCRMCWRGCGGARMTG